MSLSNAAERRARQQEEIDRIDAGGSALEGSEELPPEEHARFKKPMAHGAPVGRTVAAVL